ncbi:MAG: hypothetical protein ABSD53_15530 [Terriglobales bacterium]|jgi:hypothetical protein
MMKADWIAAISLSIQAVILAVQAGFFYWQARILRRHAKTLEEHTEIAGTQAKTAELIGRALDQQGKILAEQTVIMAEQFGFHQRVTTQLETMNVLKFVIAAHRQLVLLDSKLSRGTMYPTAEFRQDVDRHFDDLAGAMYECRQAVLLSLHLTVDQKKFFLSYCDDLAKITPTGNNNRDLAKVHPVNEKYRDALIAANMESLGLIS